MGLFAVLLTELHTDSLESVDFFFYFLLLKASMKLFCALFGHCSVHVSTVRCLTISMRVAAEGSATSHQLYYLLMLLWNLVDVTKLLGYEYRQRSLLFLVCGGVVYNLFIAGEIAGMILFLLNGIMYNFYIKIFSLCLQKALERNVV